MWEAVFAPDVSHWDTSESRQAVPSENLCHPRHHKRGDRVSGGVERSETVLESSSLPAVRTGEGPVVYKVRERQQFVQEKA